MYIKKESPDTLTLKDTINRRLSLGVFCLIVGLAMLLTPTNTQEKVSGVFFILIGICLISFSRSRITTFDKSTGTLTQTQKGIFRRSKKTIPFADIAHVELRERVTHTRYGTSNLNNIVLVVKDGSDLALDAQHNQTRVIFGKSKLEAEREVAQKIASFIGVPFKGVVTSGDPQTALLDQLGG